MAPTPPDWFVAREVTRFRWGGDLRRHYVLSALAARPDAIDMDGWSVKALRQIPVSVGDARPTRVAVATMLGDAALSEVLARGEATAVDIHDDPVAQRRALGLPLDTETAADIDGRKRRNLDAFRWALVPSEGLGRIAGTDPARTIVVPNGTDTSIVIETPWPSTPTVALTAGAAPGRGIEAVIEACRLVREQVPETELILWLAATGAESEVYLRRLEGEVRADQWVHLGSAPYQQLGQELGRAMVHCVPTPSSEYWDAVSPIKLFDAMASARPVVTTPRKAPADDVRRYDAGIVAKGDGPEQIAEAILVLLSDESLARRLGANGRAAAIAKHDWRGIAEDLATTLVSRAGVSG